MRSRLRPLLRSNAARAAAAAALAAAALAMWIRCGPLPDGLLDTSRAQSTVVVDRTGVPLYEALSGDGTRAVAVSPDAIPETIAAATVAAEDRRFWTHAGVDPAAVARALRRNLLERRVVEGGSTITQQTAKLLLARLEPERRRGLPAKLREAIIALRLEHRLDKREILALYLNLASYGNQIGGVERASRAYFGTSAGTLTPAQAAFLAGLPQRPRTFNPYRGLELARSRQRVVLARLAAAGLLGREDLERAREERLTLIPPDRPFLAPHFVEMVLSRTAAPRPARIVTTIDAALQEDVAGIIRSHRPALEQHGAANVAVVVLDHRRGEWVAWEGSGNYFDPERGGAINGPLAPRQPGSALKPFTYALAFEEGRTPADVLPDVPMHFPTAEPGVVYSPRNYDGRYRGPLLARAALAGSENVPAVALTAELGVPALLRFLHRAGFSTFDRSASHYGLGLTLGNAEVRLDELVAAYGAFARGGEWIEPTWLLRRHRVPDRRTLISPRTAFWVSDILSDAEARAYIFGRGGSLELPFPVAVKTGTSQAYHDNWTVGYSSHVTVGVWVGNFDRRPLRHSSGVTGAAPIFHAVMLAAHARAGGGEAPPAAPDAALAWREICALSGEFAGAWCPARRREWLDASQEVPPCSWHHDDDGELLVVWPAPFGEWARKNGLAGSLQPAATPVKAAVRARPQSTSTRVPALQLVNPPSGATYLIDPTLRPEFQTLRLRVIARAPTTVTWTIGGAPLGRGSSEAPLEWPLRRGRHVFAVRDGQGNTAESVVTVR